MCVCMYAIRILTYGEPCIFLVLVPWQLGVDELPNDRSGGTDLSGDAHQVSRVGHKADQTNVQRLELGHNFGRILEAVELVICKAGHCKPTMKEEVKSWCHTEGRSPRNTPTPRPGQSIILVCSMYVLCRFSSKGSTPPCLAFHPISYSVWPLQKWIEQGNNFGHTKHFPPIKKKFSMEPWIATVYTTTAAILKIRYGTLDSYSVYNNSCYIKNPVRNPG